MDVRYKSKHLLALLLALGIAVGLLLVGCRKQVAPPGATDTPPPEEQTPTPQVPTDTEASIHTLVLSYLLGQRAEPDERVYFAADAPDAPQEGDYRIDGMAYAGETRLYESVGVAYEVEYSRYLFTRNENMEKVYGWHEYDPYYIVLRRSGYDDTWDGVFGCSDSVDPDKSVEDAILEVAYGLEDIEVSLRLDGYPQRVGPFSAPNFFHEEAVSEVLEGWEPVYQEGDYWIRYYYEGLTATCYYNALESTAGVYNLEATRTDVETHRGLRVGMTRDEVFAAYPDLYHTQYWGYEGDYLWYCDNDGGWGAALLFWFQDGIVVKIELNDMFD